MYEIFVINLDAQKARWAFMQKQLHALNLQPHRLPAINGYNPETRQSAGVASFAPLPSGEVGCFESHRNAWAEIVRQDLPGAFILEDDIFVASDFGKLNFPTILLECTDIIKLDMCSWIADYGPVTHQPAPNRELRPLWGSETSAGCYFMTRRGAEKMLRHAHAYFLPVDTLMFDMSSKAFYDLVTLKILPAVAAQMRYVLPKEELAEEIVDGMQEKRRLLKDPRPAMTPFRRARLYLRRLVDWDFRAIRERRQRRFQSRNGPPLQTGKITFQTPDRAHIDIAMPALERR